MRRNRFKYNQDVFKEYLSDLKEFIQEFRGGFSDELKEFSNFRVNRRENGGLDFLPVEIWETKEKYFIQTYLGVIKDLSDVQVSIRNDHSLVLKVYFTPNKPAENCWMVNTEYPNFLKREFTFLHKIIDSTLTLQNGVLVIGLEKQIRDVEPPMVVDAQIKENDQFEDKTEE